MSMDWFSSEIDTGNPRFSHSMWGFPGFSHEIWSFPRFSHVAAAMADHIWVQQFMQTRPGLTSAAKSGVEVHPHWREPAT